MLDPMPQPESTCWSGAGGCALPTDPQLGRPDDAVPRRRLGPDGARRPWHAYSLAAVVTTLGHGYRVSSDDLGGYMIPKRGHALSIDELRETNRGTEFTRSAFAYLFRRG